MIAFAEGKAALNVDVRLAEHRICRLQCGGSGVWRAQGEALLPAPLRGQLLMFMLCLGQET